MPRIKIVNFIALFIFLLLAFNLLNLEIIRGKEFKELSNKNCIRVLPQEGSRGRILERNGNIIAGNSLCYDLTLIPAEARQIDRTLIFASEVLRINPKELKERFRKSLIGSFTPITIARDIDIKEAIALEELKSDLSGMVIQPRPVRAYPYARLACHIIGYLNEIDRWRLTKLADYGYKTKDTVGFGGVEEQYDYYLRQEEGGLSVEADYRGRFMRVLGFRPPRSGKDIQLTLDLKIQKIIEEKLADRTGCVIVMDPYSGEITGLASHPNFNPEVFVKKSNVTIYNLFRNPDAPLINRAISGLYPAGSVFKLVVATAALEAGKINLSTTFLCSGSTRIGKKDFSCWDTHGKQNLLNGIANSCNIFFYNVGLLVGAQGIHDWALKLGFGKPTYIDLPYEEAGFVPSPLWKKVSKLKKWFDGDTANLSIGQSELLVTPLQICLMMAVFAKKGYLVTPYIVKAIDGRDISMYRKRILKLPIKESTINYIREGLRKAVADPSGTARELSGLSVTVAGKTGTPQAPPGQPHGWFVGFFSFKNPKFVICVFLERGGSGYAASIVAKQIIEAMIKEGLV